MPLELLVLTTQLQLVRTWLFFVFCFRARYSVIFLLLLRSACRQTYILHLTPAHPPARGGATKVYVDIFLVSSL